MRSSRHSMQNCSNNDQYPSDCELLAQMRNRSQQQEAPYPHSKPLLDRAAKIRLLLLDVDGVLTDGTLIYDSEGRESKGFNTQDGFGIRLLQEAGIDVGVITARKSEAVKKRCENLNMRYIYMGQGNKIVAYNEITQKSGLKPVEICYMGDDWLDMILLKRVGLAAAPANAVTEIQQMVHIVTERGGGMGAVREICALILQAKGLLESMLQSYMNR